MARYGLIGRPLGHSFSRSYFTEKFTREGRKNDRYDLFELEAIEQLPRLIADTPGLRGLNVTIPYKESVVPLLDELDPLAAAVGAVNTIRIADGRLIGHNTDVFGFRSLAGPVAASLKEPGSDIRPRALVLGSGGASRAVAFVLRELGIRFRVVGRDRTKGDLTWDMLDRTVISVCKLVVNATPLGMHPHVDEAPPLPYAALTPKHVLIDLVYNPERTLFLEQGAAQGARTIGGLGMLHAQAEEAWRVWNT
ncbi:MAG: shikimate dehydrogenase [Flavobacteriales bacterium]